MLRAKTSEGLCFHCIPLHALCSVVNRAEHMEDIPSTLQMSGGAACGSGGLSNCAGGNSDPVMYGFAGRSFNFIGDPGKIYNVISTQNMQASHLQSTERPCPFYTKI